MNTPMNELCMIGNDYQKDIVTPKKLGMKTVLITSTPGAYPSADHTVSRFDELISIFGKNILTRPAMPADINALASMNKQLIEDEKHNNLMTARQLKERMEGFLSGDYTALLFADADGGTIGYALVDKTTNPLYLRQFFICRDERRKGYGRRFFYKLLDYLDVETVDIEVLAWNVTSRAFWESLNFKPRSVYMRYEGKINGLFHHQYKNT